MRKVKVSYAITHAILKVEPHEATTNAVNSAIEKMSNYIAGKYFYCLYGMFSFVFFKL